MSSKQSQIGEEALACTSEATRVELPTSKRASRRRFLQSGLASAATASLTNPTMASTGPGPSALAGAETASQERKLNTSPDTYVLFLDLLEVDELVLCEQFVSQAEKHPSNPVLAQGDIHDWDGDRATNWGGSLFYDAQEKLFKLWYHGRDVVGTANRQLRSGIGYAVSEDGAVWHKPRLGLYDYDGNRDNNICFRSPDGMTGHFCVVKDPRESNPQRRYQALTEQNLIPGDRSSVKHVPYYSADGVHWERGGDFVAEPRNGTDTGCIVIDESAAPQQRFRAYGQHACFTGPDIKSLKLVGDVIDPREGAEHEIHFVYTSRYRNDYPMLYDYNYHRPYFSRREARDPKRQRYLRERMSLERGDLPVEESDSDYQIYVGDIRLASSRDPLGRFRRVRPRQPVVARGRRGEWDSGFLSLGGECFIEHEGRILIFYSGLDERSATGFPGLSSGPYATGLASLPIDGFTFLRAADPISRGTMRTKPIRVANPASVQLSLNISHTMPWRDWIEVEVLDAKTQRPISGYGREDARLMEDSATQRVKWQNRHTLEDVGVPEICLAFHFYGEARLYSFTFKEV